MTDKRQLDAKERIVVHDRVDITVRRSGDVIAHRSSGSLDPKTSTDIESDRVTYRIEGRSRQGEDGNLHVASILRQVLNALGDNWGPPEDASAERTDVDVRLHDGARKLELQITRAEQEIWSNLARRGHADLALSATECAARLFDAITNKREIPPEQRKGLVLVLNALDAPAATMSGVLAEFRTRHGSAVAALGFAAVWLVGPTTELVTRLA